MAVRLRDVAARAGVSVRTASNVVNGYEHVKPVTREKVQAAIDELGYRPNLSARQLKYGRSGFLTLAIPRLDWPYFGELAQKFTEAAAELGWIALMDVTGGRLDSERLILSGLQSHMVDGVVFSPLEVSADDIRSRGDRTPMVLLGERAIPAGHDHVAVDSVEASRAMVEHLVAEGRCRIGVIGYQSRRGTASVRQQGYLQGLVAAGLPFEPGLAIGVTGYLRSEGFQAMQRLLALSDPPDAVYCFNDLMAIGALAACREAGVRVPEDVAIAGFDDIAEARFSAPGLTTIAPDLDVLTREVLRLLVGRLDGTRDGQGAESVKVPWRLLVRGSTVPGAGHDAV